MSEHPIEGLMNTAMSNLQDMINVDTVIGESIELENGTVIIPISKVSFGFAAGGSEWGNGSIEQTKRQGQDEESKFSLPFGGGSGAGVNITPIGFLVVSESGAKMLPVNHCNALDKLLDYVPDLIEKISDVCGCNCDQTYTYEFYEDEDGNCSSTCTCKSNDDGDNEKSSSN